MTRKLTLWLIALLLLGTSVQAQALTELTVFAASSLTDAFLEIGTAFESANPNVRVVFNFGGSSTLATQLIEGAPADVYASANPNQMQVAQEAGRILNEPAIFAHNELVLVTPSDNPAGIESLRDLSGDNIKLVVAAPEVPVRQYTDTMLEQLAADADFGPAYRDAVYANVVSEESNVRQVMLKVVLGEADAGIVYSSDVTPDASDQVLRFPIPAAVNTIANYPIAVTTGSSHPDLAQSFVDFVRASEGQDILVKWGFISIEPQTTTTSTAPQELTLNALMAMLATLVRIIWGGVF
ncbi:MAG: molybdate ABC transporter substrate-binding protein [Anaerolineae bacterium]|nr:molybdate ABC transporter substrate-binding protein [Anaerolineae bacterium]